MKPIDAAFTAGCCAALIVTIGATASLTVHAEQQGTESPQLPTAQNSLTEPKHVRTIPFRTGQPEQLDIVPAQPPTAPNALASPKERIEPTQPPTVPDVLTNPKRVRTVTIRPDRPDQPRGTETAQSPPWPKWLIEPTHAPTTRTGRPQQRRSD
jgi:hypothetical protein